MPIYKINNQSKDGKQAYRVVVNFSNALGESKRIERRAYGMAEARELEASLQRQFSTVKNASPNMTVGELYEEYIAYKSREVRATTLAKSQQQLNLYVLPYFADKPLQKVNTRKVLTEWKLLIDGMDKTINTKNDIFTEFRTLLSYAVKNEYIDRNVLSLLGSFKNTDDFGKSEEKIQYYTYEQFKAFISAAEETAKKNNTLTDWGYYIFFNIAFFTGMRKGEINALKWSDIELNFVHVRRSINQKMKGGDTETPPKNRSSYRTIQMPEHLVKLLLEHKERQKQDSDFSEGFRVCGGRKALRDSTLSNRNTAYAKSAGLSPIRIHDFRHSHASLLANEGINIQEIARRLGHSNIEITWNTYSHMYPREEERAVKILDNLK